MVIIHHQVKLLNNYQSISGWCHGGLVAGYFLFFAKGGGLLSPLNKIYMLRHFCDKKSNDARRHAEAVNQSRPHDDVLRLSSLIIQSVATSKTKLGQNTRYPLPIPELPESEPKISKLEVSDPKFG
jgi:hypothetical protein